MPTIQHKTVYLSGPITGLTEEEYISRFEAAAELVAAAGYVPVNPVYIQACESENCNGQTFKDSGEYLHTWQCYMKTDLIALLRCDLIYMLEGWRESKGATFELEVADKVGIAQIFLSPEG